MTIMAAQTELDAFAARRAELAAGVRRLEAHRAELDSALTDAIGEQLFEGRSTSKKQESLKRQIGELDDDLTPQRRALEQAQELFIRAEQAAARRQYEAAGVARESLLADFRSSLAELADAVEALIAVNRRLREIEDRDRAAYEAQRAAVALGRLDQEVVSALPGAGLDMALLEALAAEVRKDLARG
ncbi:MAG: hypothetical protein M3R49_03680 [Chloroflexota bacterium]|nr:hypothetical protein [Chloroflexota bacterium]